MKVLLIAALLTVPAATTAKTAPAPAPVVTAKVGATVIGKDNHDAGVIAEVTAAAIVIDTGTNKVPVPVAAVGVNPKGLWIGMTKAELDVAYAAAAQQAKASFAARLTPGAVVHDVNGAALGPIKLTDAQSVTITTRFGDAKLERSAFYTGENNSIRIGATEAQLAGALAGALTGAKAQR